MTEHPRIRVWRTGQWLDVAATLGSLRRGGADPCWRRDGAAVWWATRALGEPTTVRVWADRTTGQVEAHAWGVNADVLLQQLPRILGGDDDPSGFVPQHPVVAQAARRFAGWRVPCTGRVLEALVPAVLEQKVTSLEARAAWRRLVTRFGDPAPGPTPAPMWVSPTASAWAAVPEWEWYRSGVTPQRRDTVRRVAALGSSLERAGVVTGEQAGVVLRRVPGVGAWTEAEVRQRAFGDADVVSVGDYHLPLQVGWALTGERGQRGDDERMLRLLEPYAGHRYRVQRLVELAGVQAPRRGPRYSPDARLAVMRSPA